MLSVGEGWKMAGQIGVEVKGKKTKDRDSFCRY